MFKQELQLGVESLEQRRMLAVDVSMSGDTLQIEGDNAADFVEVAGFGTPNEVHVRINTGEFVTFQGVDSIRAKMRDGRDHLRLAGIDISGDVNVHLGDGPDKFEIAPDAQNRAPFRQVSIGGDVKAHLGSDAGDRVVWFTNRRHDVGIDVGDDVVLRGAADVDLKGEGDGSDAASADVNIGDRLMIVLSAAERPREGDFSQLRNVNVAGHFHFRGSRADDSVEIAHSHFKASSSMHLGAGDDTLVVSGGTSARNHFHSRARFHGGSGTDEMHNLQGTIFLANHSEHQFELFVEGGE